MKKFFDWFETLSNGKKFLIVGVVFVILIGGGGYFLFQDYFKAAPVEAPPVVMADIPDAEIREEDNSRLKAYSRASEYWDELEKKNEEGSLVVNGSLDPLLASSEQEYDPNEYTPLEIQQMKAGVVTKEQLDKEHAEQREHERRIMEATRPQATTPVLTQEQQDSIYFARMERTYQMAAKYTNAMSGGPAPVEQTEPEPEPRRIEIPKEQRLPQESMEKDDIICSLEDNDRPGVLYDNGKVTVAPAKATFIKTEKIIGGQRVIMRLMQDLYLSDGKVIPSNTHITGICSVGKRLEIKVSTIQYGGRMYAVDLSIYDNDGTEGIYCPVIEQKKAKKAAGNVAAQIVSGIASDAASLFTRSRTLGSAATTGIQEISSMTLRDGSVAINVSAGYEFYVFENVKEN